MVKMRHLALIVAMLSGGCANQSRPITIANALHELQGQLQAAGAVSATGAGPARLAAAARSAQCEAHTANPEVPFLAHEITINLTGSFTANGGFAVGPAITGGPPFGLSASVARGQTQALTLPLTFAALSEMPDVVAAQRAALFAGLPTAARNVEMRRVIAERDELRRQIQALIGAYDPALCGQAGVAPAGPWQPMMTATHEATPRHRRHHRVSSSAAWACVARQTPSETTSRPACRIHASPVSTGRCHPVHCRAGSRPTG